MQKKRTLAGNEITVEQNLTNALHVNSVDNRYSRAINIITGNFHNGLQHWTEFVRNAQERYALLGITNKFSPISCSLWKLPVIII